MTNPKPSRTRWKIALGVVVLFAVAVGWLVAWPAYQRHRAIAEIERVGGTVVRDTVGPQWLQKFGIGSNDVIFDLFRPQATDETLKHLSGLSNLQDLWLDNQGITDNGLKHLSGLSNLQELSLNNTAITDNGLKHLSGLSNLQFLSMFNTKITDEGLKHLSGLKNLQFLRLDDTEVTEDGVKMLQKSLPNCVIEW